MSIITISITIVAVIIILTLLAVRKHLHLKANALECVDEIRIFHERLQKLTDTSHFFTDEELHQFKHDCAPLIDKINELYNAVLISDEYLDDIGLKEFLHERKFLNHLQYQNNQKHQHQ